MTKSFLTVWRCNAKEITFEKLLFFTLYFFIFYMTLLHYIYYSYFLKIPSIDIFTFFSFLATPFLLVAKPFLRMYKQLTFNNSSWFTEMLCLIKQTFCMTQYFQHNTLVSYFTFSITSSYYAHYCVQKLSVIWTFSKQLIYISVYICIYYIYMYYAK